MSDEDADVYHFYGNLFLPDPEKSLPPKTLRRLRQIEPFLKELGKEQDAQPRTWDAQDAFVAAVDAKVRLWQQRRVSRRPDFTVRPDGPLEATVACHLHCPSFSVKDPSCARGADHSNVSISQIMRAGFTPDRCLIYDHLFRREALDGIRHYPPEILGIHEAFTRNLRKNMSAVVDVCWGKCVQKRMLQTVSLERLQLWGPYKDVTLWLEWDDPRSQSDRHLVRFVLFVMHPEAMIFADRSTLGKLQDIHLAVAARLGGITVDENYYETNHRRGTYGRLLRVEWERQKDLNAEATAQVLSCATATACPTSESLLLRSGPLFPGTVLPSGLPCDQGQMGESQSGEEETPDVTDDIYSTSVPKVLPEVDAVVEGPQGLKCLISSLVDASFGIDEAMQLLSLGESEEFGVISDPGWNSIPSRLCDWLGKQKGLRIDGVPISSTTELRNAHRLLCRKTSPLLNTEDRSLVRLILDVALRYFKQVSPVRRISTLGKLTVSGKNPVPRKCGGCGSRVLDDAFPRFKKRDPSKYVTRYLKAGCGLDICRPKGVTVWAVPVDDRTPWSPPDADALKRPPQRAAWTDVLLRPGEEAASLGLPSSVECICRGCESKITTDEDPRWTIESMPRYIPRRPRCVACHNKCTNYRPTDPTVKWLDAAAVSKKWAQIQREGWAVPDILEHPDRYFPKVRQTKC
ncbi:hypothetical protein VTK73DRAFT_7365 [Phialemonium thermophilum]|uniref:Uncharacterized protein n=1 Tax=Phialemonium thermophilum TaxID=223376 RepID=A0ABR3WEZ8_9PEZI